MYGYIRYCMRSIGRSPIGKSRCIIVIDRWGRPTCSLPVTHHDTPGHIKSAITAIESQGIQIRNKGVVPRNTFPKRWIFLFPILREMFHNKRLRVLNLCYHSLGINFTLKLSTNSSFLMSLNVFNKEKPLKTNYWFWMNPMNAHFKQRQVLSQTDVSNDIKLH